MSLFKHLNVADDATIKSVCRHYTPLFKIILFALTGLMVLLSLVAVLYLFLLASVVVGGGL